MSNLLLEVTKKVVQKTSLKEEAILPVLKDWGDWYIINEERIHLFIFGLREGLEPKKAAEMAEKFWNINDDVPHWIKGGMERRLRIVFEAVKASKEITISDYSNFDSSRCYTGGSYGYDTVYTRQDDGNFVVEYFTTSEFPYCRKCGSFYQSGDGWQHDDCQHPIVTPIELLYKLIMLEKPLETDFFHWFLLKRFQRFEKALKLYMDKISEGMFHDEYPLREGLVNLLITWAERQQNLDEKGRYTFLKNYIKVDLQTDKYHVCKSITKSCAGGYYIPPEGLIGKLEKVFVDVNFMPLGFMSPQQAKKLQDFLAGRDYLSGIPTVWKAKNAFKHIEEKGIKSPQINMTGDFPVIEGIDENGRLYNVAAIANIN